MYEHINYQSCGYCENNSICNIREKYMKSSYRHSGGSAELAKNCVRYSMDSKANPFIWGTHFQ